MTAKTPALTDISNKKLFLLNFIFPVFSQRYSEITVLRFIKPVIIDLLKTDYKFFCLLNKVSCPLYFYYNSLMNYSYH